MGQRQSYDWKSRDYRSVEPKNHPLMDLALTDYSEFSDPAVKHTRRIYAAKALDIIAMISITSLRAIAPICTCYTVGWLFSSLLTSRVLKQITHRYLPTNIRHALLPLVVLFFKSVKWLQTIFRHIGNFFTYDLLPGVVRILPFLGPSGSPQSNHRSPQPNTAASNIFFDKSTTNVASYPIYNKSSPYYNPFPLFSLKGIIYGLSSNIRLFLEKVILPQKISNAFLPDQKSLSIFSTIITYVLRLYMLLETMFLLYFVSIKSQFNQPSVPTSDLPTSSLRRAHLRLLLTNLLDQCPLIYLRKWFLGANVFDIRHRNLVEWIAGSFYNKQIAELSQIELREIDNTVQYVVAAVGISPLPGYNPNVKCVRFTLDSLNVIHRPLIMYGTTIAVNDLVTTWVLKKMGFTYHEGLYTSYWYRPATNVNANQKAVEYRQLHTYSRGGKDFYDFVNHPPSAYEDIDSGIGGDARDDDDYLCQECLNCSTCCSYEYNTPSSALNQQKRKLSLKNMSREERIAALKKINAPENTTSQLTLEPCIKCNKTICNCRDKQRYKGYLKLQTTTGNGSFTGSIFSNDDNNNVSFPIDSGLTSPLGELSLQVDHNNANSLTKNILQHKDILSPNNSHLYSSGLKSRGSSNSLQNLSSNHAPSITDSITDSINPLIHLENNIYANNEDDAEIIYNDIRNLYPFRYREKKLERYLKKRGLSLIPTSTNSSGGNDDHYTEMNLLTSHRKFCDSNNPFGSSDTTDSDCDSDDTDDTDDDNNNDFTKNDSLTPIPNYPSHAGSATPIFSCSASFNAKVATTTITDDTSDTITLRTGNDHIQTHEHNTPPPNKCKSTAVHNKLHRCPHHQDHVRSRIDHQRRSDPHKSPKLSKPSADASLDDQVKYAESLDYGAIVFCHGIGVGIIAYVKFIEAMIERYPNKDIFLPNFRFISMAFPSNYVPSCHQLISSIRHMLISNGHQNAIFFSHSYGTFICSFILRYAPSIVKHVVLIDPVCFSIHSRDSSFNFLSKDIENTQERLINFIAQRELGVVYTICRKLWWYQAILFDFLIPTGSTVVLSARDSIAPSFMIRNYLQTSAHRIRLIWFDNFAHAGFISSPEAIHQILDCVAPFRISKASRAHRIKYHPSDVFCLPPCPASHIFTGSTKKGDGDLDICIHLQSHQHDGLHKLLDTHNGSHTCIPADPSNASTFSCDTNNTTTITLQTTTIGQMGGDTENVLHPDSEDKVMYYVRNCSFIPNRHRPGFQLHRTNNIPIQTIATTTTITTDSTDPQHTHHQHEQTKIENIVTEYANVPAPETFCVDHSGLNVVKSWSKWDPYYPSFVHERNMKTQCSITCASPCCYNKYFTCFTTPIYESQVRNAHHHTEQTTIVTNTTTSYTDEVIKTESK